MYPPVNVSRLLSGDENNASEGRYHTPFIIGSQIMEECLIRFFPALRLYCSILLLLRLSSNVSVGLDEASCPRA